MRFVPTSQRPDAASHFAEMQLHEWGHLYPNASVERSRHDLLNNRWDGSTLPSLRLAWFALDDAGVPLGVAMLVGDGEVEPADEAELPGPWFAGLVVDPRFRERGVATALLEHVKDEARSLGFDHLRLVTEHEASFYERRGWTTERMVELNSVPNTVMFATLA